jgi:ribulose-5-phosphate 4-epimerase/fuculose-1-phosphate aldolase
MMTSLIPGLSGKNYSLDISSMRDKVSAAEWEARVTLAACYRLMALWDMTDMIANHISLRVPGEPEHFLVNAYGLLYEEITASSLIKVDLDGNVIAKPDFDYDHSRVGFIIHSAIHRARHDAECVIHTHTPAGMAVSAMACGFLPMTQTAMRFPHVAYHDFEGGGRSGRTKAPGGQSG